MLWSGDFVNFTTPSCQIPTKLLFSYRTAGRSVNLSVWVSVSAPYVTKQILFFPNELRWVSTAILLTLHPKLTGYSLSDVKTNGINEKARAKERRKEGISHGYVSIGRWSLRSRALILLNIVPISVRHTFSLPSALIDLESLHYPIL